MTVFFKFLTVICSISWDRSAILGTPETALLVWKNLEELVQTDLINNYFSVKPNKAGLLEEVFLREQPI